MRHGWLDPHRQQFTPHRLAAVRDLSLDRLAELQELQRAHAQIYRDAPLTEAPDLVARLHRVLEPPT
jgi:hypothetical protein